MDTRTKIVSAAEALRLSMAGATVVSGIFDPMIAAHAERLAGLKRPGSALLVLINKSSDEILPVEARAHLVAGLREVDHVAVVSPETPAAQIRLEGEHQKLREQLVEHVHSRQGA
jgi:bifunctional ADP-heptose synthase (sugar kinase/adenylyltransferase)